MNYAYTSIWKRTSGSRLKLCGILLAGAHDLHHDIREDGEFIEELLEHAQINSPGFDARAWLDDLVEKHTGLAYEVAPISYLSAPTAAQALQRARETTVSAYGEEMPAVGPAARVPSVRLTRSAGRTGELRTVGLPRPRSGGRVKLVEAAPFGLVAEDEAVDWDAEPDEIGSLLGSLDDDEFEPMLELAEYEEMR